MRLVVSAASRPLPVMVCRLAPSPAVMLSCCTTTTACERSGFSYSTFVLPRLTSTPFFIAYLSLQLDIEHARLRGTFLQGAQPAGKRLRLLGRGADVAFGPHQRSDLFFRQVAGELAVLRQ